MMQKTKPAQKMVRVVARAGFGGKLRTRLPLTEAKSATPDELLEQLIDHNLQSENPTDRGVARSLQNIRSGATCDIDMRVHADNETVNITHLRKHAAIDEQLHRKEIEDEALEEIELVAAGVATGGVHAG